LFALLLFSNTSTETRDPGTAERAVSAFRVLGWTTARSFLDAPRRQRVATLASAGITRAKEVEAKLAGAAHDVEERFGGDRKLRREASHKPTIERSLLLRLKWVGQASADTFLQMVQVAWPEDTHSLDSAP
jgi:endonuclease III